MNKDRRRHLVDDQYTVRDLVDIPKLRKIFQHFTDTMGFTIGFLSVPDMDILIATGWRDICTKFHRRCPIAAENCRKSNVHLTQQMNKPGKVVIEACANGLVDCAMPIFIKGKCVAILATGQVLLETPNRARFQRQAKVFGCNEKKYMAALKEVPVISEQRLKQVTGFLKELASLVAELGYAGLKEKEKSRELALDIEKRELAEKKLKETTDQLQAIFDSTFQFISLLSPEGKVLEANHSSLQFAGLKAQDVQGQFFWDCRWWTISRQTQQKLRKAVAQASRGRFVRYPVKVWGVKGATITIDFSLKPVRNEKGRVTMLTAEGRDITDRQNAEESLRMSAAEWQSTFDSVGDVVWLLSPEGRILRTNKAVFQVLGKKPEEVLGRRCCELVHTSRQSPVPCPLSRMRQSRRRESWEFKLSHRWFRVTVDPIADGKGALVGAVHVMSDITVRRQGEEALQASEGRYRELVNLAPDGILAGSSEGIITEANQSMSVLSGLSQEEMVGKHIGELFFTEESLKKHPFRFDLLKNGKTVVRERSIIRPDGSIVEVEMRTKMMPDGTYQSIYRDITARKRVEADLQTSEQRFRSIFESAKDAMMTLEPPFWRFTSGNAAMVKMFKAKDLKELISLSPWRLSPKRQPDGSLSAEKAKAMIQTALRQGTHFFDWIHRRTNGEAFPCEVLLSRVQIEGEGVLLHATVREITDRKRFEHDLLASETRFRRLFEAAKDGILILNAKTGTIDEVNPYLIELLGYSHKVFLGKKIWELGFFKDVARNRAHFLQLQRKKYVRYADVPLETADGRRINVEFISNVYAVDNQKVIQCNIRNITDRRIAEKALQDSEERFRLVVNNSLDLVYRRNIQTGRYDFFSSAAKQILGFTPEELIGKDLRFATSRIHPDDLKKLMIVLKRAKSGALKSGFVEYRCKHRDGSYRWLSDRFTIVNDASGRPLYWVGVSRDVTHAKQAELALLESEKRFRRIVEQSPIAMAIVNRKGAIEFLNRKAITVFGYQPEDIPNMNRWWVQAYPDAGYRKIAIADWMGRVQRASDKGYEVKGAEYQVTCKNGAVKTMLISGALIAEKIFVLFDDITERKQTESLLKQREAYLTSMIENQPGMVWLKDKDSRFLAVNRMFVKMAGKNDPEDVVGKTDLDIWPQKLANKFRADDRKVMRERKHMVTEELISEKALLRWHETFKTPVFDMNGKVIGTTGFARDITDRKKAEDALRASEEKLQLQFMSMPIGAILWDAQLRPLSWNPAAEKIFGYSAKEAIGRCAYDFILPAAVKPRIRKIWRGLLQGEKTVHSINENITKNGKTILCRWTNTPLYGNDGKVFGVLSMAEDITKYTKAEEALRASERMLRESQTIAGVGSYVLDITKRVWTSSPVLDDVFGIEATPEHLMTEWEALVHPDWRAGMWAYLTKDVVGKRSRFDREYKIIRPRDGQERWVHGLGELEFDGKGRPVRMVGTVMDITERKKMEQALEKRILALTQPEGTGASIEFEDLFNLDEIQKIQDEFTKATGVASIITRVDGTPITKPSHFCRLCNDIIRATEKGLANCYRSDACIGRPNPEGPIIQTCLSGGLWDAGASIAVGGRHIANWLIGQVRDETQSEEKIRAYARLIGADEEKAAQAFREVTPMPRVQFEKVAQLLFTMATQLSQFAYQNLQQARAITESKQAESLIRAGRHQLFQVIDTVPHMIFAKDREGRFLLANRAVAQAYQREPRELIGVRRQDIHKEASEVASFLKGDLEVLATGKPTLIANEPFTDLQGKKHILQTIKIPFKMAGLGQPCILGVSVDVTEQRKVEEYRNDIVRTVSHELRTPLSIEKEGISLLVDEVVGPVNVEQKEILETVMRSIDRLARMITNLLDISSIETGKVLLSMKRTDLVTLAKDVVFEFKKRAKEKGITLDVGFSGAPVEISLDPDKITQVMSNLMDNAIKFTPAKGSVTISLKVSAKEAICEVRDTGVGISRENMGKLFEKFQQFSRMAGPGEKGFGLGLSIAKGLIELHCGRIWAESELGTGTRVSFALPLRAPGRISTPHSTGGLPSQGKGA